MYSPKIQKLINLFSKFPTVGPRTAARFVFYLAQKPKEEIDNLIEAILDVKNNIKTCPSCFKTFDSNTEACEICENPGRNKKLLCVVEKEVDLETIEKTKKYQGLYFIFGPLASPLKKNSEDNLRINVLEEKMKNNPEVQEIIIAINPTAEGEATTLLLERKLKPYAKKITRLGRGLPIGGELEYADQETLASALENRK